MRISDWSSDVCASDLADFPVRGTKSGPKSGPMQKILRGGAIVAASAMLLSCSTAIIPEGAAPPAVASRPVNPPARIPQYNPRSQPSPALVKIIHDLGRNFHGHEIGRQSWREKV